jgi:hypothetical protein
MHHQFVRRRDDGHPCHKSEKTEKNQRKAMEGLGARGRFEACVGRGAWGVGRRVQGLGLRVVNVCVGLSVVWRLASHTPTQDDISNSSTDPNPSPRNPHTTPLKVRTTSFGCWVSGVGCRILDLDYRPRGHLQRRYVRCIWEHRGRADSSQASRCAGNSPLSRWGVGGWGLGVGGGWRGLETLV